MWIKAAEELSMNIIVIKRPKEIQGLGMEEIKREVIATERQWQ